MKIIFISTYCIWFVFELLLNRLVRAKQHDKQGTDKHSLKLLWFVIISSIALAVLSSIYNSYKIAQTTEIEYVGLILILLGIIFRIIAIINLGKFFTVDVTIKQDHQLIRSGMYKYMRHPSYLFSIISFIGFGLSLNNWLSLALATLPVIATFIRRMNIEEQALIDRFGEQYIEYQNETKRLVPFIY